MTLRALLTPVILVPLVGCGPPTAKVSGKVTCGSNPVKGTIQFSPLGQGEAVTATIGPDGSYAADLKTSGKHRIVVSPSDVAYPAKPGQEYPCALTPQEQELKPGSNEVNIGLSPRSK